MKEIINHKNKKYIKTLSGYREILSSTDKSLGLPAPDNNSIQYIIDEFNSGKTEVYGVVERKEYLRADNGHQTGRYFTITNPDNTISIKPIEESWDDIYREFEYFSASRLIDYLKQNYSVPTKLK